MATAIYGQGRRASVVDEREEGGEHEDEDDGCVQSKQRRGNRCHALQGLMQAVAVDFRIVHDT